MPLLNSMYNKPKTAYPAQNNSWGWNAANPIGNLQQAQQPATGMGALQQPNTGTLIKAPGPSMGMSYEPPPAAQNPGAMVQAPGPAMGSTSQPPQMGQPTQSPGYQPGAFNTQYGTLPNIEQYMNPYLDQIIEKGNKNILSNASARGLLGSSGTGNELGEWAGTAQANAYNDAFGRFTQDRGYMTDQFRDSRNFDYGNFRDTNAWNYGLYTDERQDYNTRMKDWYNAMNGMSNTGMNAAGNVGDIYGNLGMALAQLYGAGGDVGAQQAINQGNNNTGLVSGILGLLGLGGK